MAQIFKPKAQSRNNKSRKHKSKGRQLADFIGVVSDYDPKAKGIIKTDDGRVAFVTGALKGEEVKVRPQTYTDKIIEAQVIDVLTPSEKRLTPDCPVFNDCGGCQLQYMPDDEQVSAKQHAFNGLIQKQLKIDNVPWQPALIANPWHYRRTARLVTWVHSNGKVSLGFRQEKSKHIVDINACPVLVKSLSDLISPLQQLLQSLAQKKAITHVQLFHLEGEDSVVFRAPDNLTLPDRTALVNFAQQHKTTVLLEAQKDKFELLFTAHDNAGSQLKYQYKGINYEFTANNFIQVNHQINELMIEQALNWLNVQSDDTVLDLFSGIGNFTLPLAKQAANVIAVEGVNDMVKKIASNAKLNDCKNVKAFQADLSKLDEKYKPQWLKPIDKLLLDPARDGAYAVVKKIPILKPKTILYVSCNPTTMIRDLKVLLNADYRLTKLGLLNMFPQTSHVEAMALLELK